MRPSAEGGEVSELLLCRLDLEISKDNELKCFWKYDI